jgi:AcrR family transcriptional regulator
VKIDGMVPKSNRSASAARAEKPVPWAERPMQEVLDAGAPEVPGRSRQIIEAAYDLLAEEGLEGLTIRAVLEKTGLSRRAFYERFAGKDELMVAVFERTVRQAASHYSEQAAALSDPLECLELIVTCIVLGKSSPEALDYGHSNRRGAAMSREHLRLADSRPQELQAALSPLITLIARQLSRGMEAGSVRRCAAERLATLVYNLVATTVHTELLAHETAPPDRARRVQLAKDIWEFCRGAIAA